MTLRACGLSITFNGEIYNYIEIREELESKGHVFSTASDTEVLLAAYAEWGTDCLARLEGMFAFAIMDHDASRLIIARDRAGEKPLYFTHDKDRLCFASELVALLACSTRNWHVDEDALNEMLTMGYCKAPLSLVASVAKLRPGHFAEFDLLTGALVVRRYWNLPAYDGVNSRSLDHEQKLCELEGLLERAVGRQLRSDVPVGVMLSGGVDSSVIAALAARRVNALQTFTVTFRGGGRLDERAYARRVAEAIGAEHHEIEAGDIDVGMIQQIADSVDEPIIDSSFLPTYLLSRVLRRHCTVALGGDGGDELFGGYSRYQRILWMRLLAGALPQRLRQVCASVADFALPEGVSGRQWFVGAGFDLVSELPSGARFFGPLARKTMFPSLGCRGNLRGPVDEEVLVTSGDTIQAATRGDFATYLPDDVLHKLDRASMRSSLEVRAPFLDRAVIEFAFRCVDSDEKVSLSRKKVLLGELANRLLPGALDTRRKQGFSIPVRTLLQDSRVFAWTAERALARSAGRSAVKRLASAATRSSLAAEMFLGLAFLAHWRSKHNISLD